jgi:ABC-type glycerol-3-phosphate transport system substrate-binding protein
MGSSSDLRASLLNTSLSRRRALGVGGGLAASLALGGRTAGRVAAQAADPVSPIAASGGLEDQEIRVLLFSGPENDAHKRLAAQFTEYTQGKVKVTVEEGGRDVDYQTKFVAAMQAGSDVYDVIHTDAQGFLQYGPANFFEPLETFMSDTNLFNATAYNLEDFPASLLALFQHDGTQRLLPQEASTLMFYYRKDLLQKYGVPEPPITGYSLDEMRQHALTIQDALNTEGLTDTYGLVLGAKPQFHAAINIVQPAWAKGAEFFTEDFHPQMESQQMVDATTFMTNLLLQDKVVSPGVVGYEYPEVLTAFQQGKAAMALQWNAAAATILDPTKSPISATTTGFAAYPYDATAGQTQQRVFPSVHGIGVSHFSKKQQAAFAYVAWFTSKEIARDYVVNGGGSSGRGSLLNDPEILAAAPYYSAVFEGFKVYHPLPQLTQWPYMYGNFMGVNFNSIWTEQVSVADGLAQMQQEMTDYLTDEGVI